MNDGHDDNRMVDHDDGQRDYCSDRNWIHCIDEAIALVIPDKETHVIKLPSERDDGGGDKVSDRGQSRLLVKQLRYFNKAFIKRLIMSHQSSSDEMTISGSSPGMKIPGLDTNSDLEAGRYEGGFTVWECTCDLIDFLSGSSTPLLRPEGKHVLDLGCGSGLVGITCLMMGAESVTFHDFNADVVRFFTLSNILLNLKSTCGQRQTQLVKEKVHLFSGDWDTFHPSSCKFDFIVSSETIYNQDSYRKLVQVIDRCLKKDNQSVALLAAKCYYFGVGGGTGSFQQFLSSTSNNCLKSSVVKVIPSSVRREILQVSRV